MFLDIRSPWSSTTAFDRLFDDFQRAAGSLRRMRDDEPGALGVWANDDAVVVTADLPGVESDQVALHLADDILTVTATRSAPTLPAGATWVRHECQTGEIRRAVQLPYRVDPDQCEARLVNGVLTVALKRSASDRPRAIAVQAA